MMISKMSTQNHPSPDIRISSIHVFAKSGLDSFSKCTHPVQKAVVSPLKAMIPTVFLHFIVLLTVTLVSSGLFAQENTSANPTHKASKSAAATASDFSLVTGEVEELEKKVNMLLKELRLLLAVEENNQWFLQNMKSDIETKVLQMCPSISLVELIADSKRFFVSPLTQQRELEFAVDLLGAVVNTVRNRNGH